MANNSNQVQKTLGEQMADLLLRKPKNFDVVFSVGPQKVQVKAVKFIMKAASPVFEQEFEEIWENGVVTDENEIPLPHFDPTAFQLFVNLLILDTWSLESIKSLNLSPNNLLNLLGLCRRYEITKAVGNLEKEADAIIESFDEYKDTPQFLEISRDNLETIFSYENLPLNETEIFNCCCRCPKKQVTVASNFLHCFNSRWADKQCTIEGLEPTGENYREVLGSILFQIRFPTMSTQEFTNVCGFKQNLLKGDEQLAIFFFFGLNSDAKTNYGITLLPFKTNRRLARKSHRSNSEEAPPQILTADNVLVNTSSSSECFVLSLPHKLTTSPFFVCDGSTKHIRYFQLKVNNKDIWLHGLGFLGPIDEDADFEVSVQIQRCIGDSCKFDSGTFKKNIFAQKGKIFYFLLDTPIAIESRTYDSKWWRHYRIIFSLKGTRSILQYKFGNPKDESFEASGVQFHFHHFWNDENPLAELLFKKTKRVRISKPRTSLSRRICYELIDENAGNS